mgnify:CR=1 FL=1
MKKQIRAALIGFGGMGRIYARMIHAGMVPGLCLSGVCCRNEAGQELLRKEFSGVQDKFAQLEPDTVDVVFIGNSHQFCSISPEILYEKYGVNSFMLATSAQTVPMSYYAAMEAIELQHPKVIVFEVSYCANNFRTVSDEMTHCFFDGMPACEARKAGLEDLVEKDERIHYYLNFAILHIFH